VDGGYIACGWTRDGRDHPTRGRPEKVWVACPRTTTTTTTTRPFWVKGSMCTAHTAQQPNRRTTDFREHTSGQPGTTGGTLFFDRGLKASSSSRLSPQRWVGGSVSQQSGSTLMHGMWAQSTPVTLNGTTREYGVVHNMAVVVAARNVYGTTQVCGAGQGVVRAFLSSFAAHVVVCCCG
jgi:hypothetical protein